MPLTIYGVAHALMRSPDQVEAMKKRLEIAATASNGSSTRCRRRKSAPVPRRSASHTDVTGERPLGWYTGRCSMNTTRLVMEEGGFLYSSDDYADDLPIF